MEEYRQWLEGLESTGLGKATGADDYFRDTTPEQRLLDRWVGDALYPFLPFPPPLDGLPPLVVCAGYRTPSCWGYV